MRPVASMWEAVATAGRGADLAEWARSVAVPAVAPSPDLRRAEVFRDAENRVVVITLWSGEPRELPPPPAELVGRPPHAWVFERVFAV